MRSTSFENQNYNKTCRDFEYTGVRCCDICHEDPEHEMDIVVVDNTSCLLCCQLRAFFYPPKDSKFDSPEEKLLNAIFGDFPHEQPND